MIELPWLRRSDGMVDSAASGGIVGVERHRFDGGMCQRFVRVGLWQLRAGMNDGTGRRGLPTRRGASSLLIFLFALYRSGFCFRFRLGHESNILTCRRRWRKG